MLIMETEEGSGSKAKSRPVDQGGSFGWCEASFHL